MNVEVLEGIATRAGWAVLHSLWQGILLGIAIALVLPFVRGSAARHALGVVAMFAMAGLLLWNIAQAPTPVVEAGAPAPSHSTVSEAQTITITGENGLEKSEPSEPTEALPPSEMVATETAKVGPQAAPAAAEVETVKRSLTDRLRPLIPWIAGFWLLGVVALSLRQCAGWWCLRRWKKDGVCPAPAPIGSLAKRVRVRMKILRELPVFVSDRVAAPVLIGVLKPVVLLPVALINTLKTEEVEAIIAHEFAHFLRRDGWTNLVQVGIETLMFYHPVIWWLSRLTRNERENATDDLALNSGTQRDTYVTALAAVAELQHVHQSTALAASGGSIVSRIRRLVAPEVSRRTAPAVAGLASMFALTLAVVTIAVGQLTTGIAQDEKAEVEQGVRIEVAPGESIQDAIDAAQAGSTLVLAEGTYAERIKIEKPLTIEGAGWEKTLIKPEGLAYDDEKNPIPSIAVSNARGVFIRGLRVGAPPQPKSSDPGPRDPLIAVLASKATIAECAIVGPAGFGIFVGKAADLELSKSLVAGIWGIGVAVQGDGDHGHGVSRLHMRETLVRNCYHRCITLGPGCDSSVIERSWISGSAWHGIRYDDASPTIEYNTIFGNARSGIYASGKTKATVRRNILMENGTGSMSCWHENSDTIQGNIFIGEERAELTVIGASKPRVIANWFIHGETAISCHTAEVDGTKVLGEPVLERNFFSSIRVPLQVKQLAMPLPEGNVNLEEEPQREAEIVLHEYGPIDDPEAAVGYIMPSGFLSLQYTHTWPDPLQEELDILPADEDTRDYEKWNKTGMTRAELRDTRPSKGRRKRLVADAREAVKPWLADALQLDDIAKREAVIENIRTALSSKDSDEIRKGLVAFTGLWEFRFDKASFHDLFVPLLESEDASLRALAPHALVMSGLRDDDVERLITMTNDPEKEVRENVATSLIRGVEKDLTGKAGDAILKLLAEDDADFRQKILVVMWGGRYSPALEARVIELSRKGSR